MPVLNRTSARAVAVVLLLISAIGLGCSSSPQRGKIGGTVSVVASWSGAEQEAFLAMVRPLEQESGVPSGAHATDHHPDLHTVEQRLARLEQRLQALEVSGESSPD